MKFEAPKFEERNNPNIPHDVRHLREFRTLLVYLGASLLILWLAVECVIWAVPRVIDIELERRWFADIGKTLISDENENTRQDIELQALADQLSRKMALPAGSISVYIKSEPTVNAYATFGGNIVVYQGILDKLENEESIAALLAHEMAHIKHRDPLRFISRSLLYSLIAAAFGSDSHVQFLANLEGMRYSRELERAADEAAVHTLAAYYGDVGGVENLFNVLDSAHKQTENRNGGREISISWLSTHPDTQERLALIREIAAQRGYVIGTPTLPNRWKK